MSNLPWIPEGLSLLHKIEGIIDANGGIAAMYEIVNEEVNGTTFNREVRKFSLVKEKIDKNKMTHAEGAELIGMTKSMFSRKMKEYKNLITTL